MLRVQSYEEKLKRQKNNAKTFMESSILLDLRSSLLTLGIDQTRLSMLSLTRSLLTLTKDYRRPLLRPSNDGRTTLLRVLANGEVGRSYSTLYVEVEDVVEWLQTQASSDGSCYFTRLFARPRRQALVGFLTSRS